MTKAGPLDPRTVLVALDGPDVSPDHVDVPVLLELAGAFFQLVRANALELATPIALTSIAVLDKCAAIAVNTDLPELAKECAGIALVQIAQGDAPRGSLVHVDRARAVLRTLPPDHNAEVIIGGWKRAIVGASKRLPPLDELISDLRAIPIRAGGKKPAVRFRSRLEEDFTLEATPELARALGGKLYQEVEITARISRDADRNIEGGRLQSFEEVEDGDPRTAWREWFGRVSGEPKDD